MPTTIIGDIHGEADLLRQLLARIDPDDDLIFVGDLIDRGHDNRGVVKTVRTLVESGRAICLMGNHELSAVLYHTRGQDGAWLREHTDVTQQKHAAFLRDYPVGDPDTQDVIDWFKGLPVFIERPNLRVIHAQWDAASIDRLRKSGGEQGSLPTDWIDRWQNDPGFQSALETLTSGQQFPLPHGQTYVDKSGHKKRDVRLSWWNARDAKRLSGQIAGPTERQQRFDMYPAKHVPHAFYPANAPTIVFGHYSLDDDQPVRAPNVICVDHTRREGGPLTAWRTDGSWFQVK